MRFIKPAGGSIRGQLEGRQTLAAHIEKGTAHALELLGDRVEMTRPYICQDSATEHVQQMNVFALIRA